MSIYWRSFFKIVFLNLKIDFDIVFNIKYFWLGASESEIFIWDVNKKSAPMNPGPKSQPLDDVRCISWNRQVNMNPGSKFQPLDDVRCISWNRQVNMNPGSISHSHDDVRCISWNWLVKYESRVQISATWLCYMKFLEHTGKYESRDQISVTWWCSMHFL